MKRQVAVLLIDKEGRQAQTVTLREPIGAVVVTVRGYGTPAREEVRYQVTNVIRGARRAVKCYVAREIEKE